MGFKHEEEIQKLKAEIKLFKHSEEIQAKTGNKS